MTISIDIRIHQGKTSIFFIVIGLFIVYNFSYKLKLK